MKSITCLQIAALCLTASLARPTSAGEPQPLPFHGTIEVAETDIFEFPVLFVDGGGVGNATHLGKFTMSFASVVNLVTREGSGSGEIVAANGDIIFTEGSGVAQVTEIDGVLIIVEDSIITGGTGRFAGATGSFTGTRRTEPVLVDGQMISHGSFAGTIILAKGK